MNRTRKHLDTTENALCKDVKHIAVGGQLFLSRIVPVSCGQVKLYIKVTLISDFDLSEHYISGTCLLCYLSNKALSIIMRKKNDRILGEKRKNASIRSKKTVTRITAVSVGPLPGYERARHPQGPHRPWSQHRKSLPTA